MSYKHLRTAALAATLLAGTGALAFAQSGMSSGSQQPSRSSPSATQSQPGSPAQSGSPGMSGSEQSSSPTTGQSTRGEQRPLQSQQGQTSSEQSPSGSGARKPSAQSSQPSEKNAQQSTEPSNKNAQQGTSPSGRTAQQPSSQQNRSMTGAAPSNEKVNLTSQQKTTIKNKIIDSKSAPRVSHVNFNIGVGVAVPSSVHLVAVPEVLVDIHPAWRGYLYFVYEDEVVIVEPHSHKIVEVIVVS